MQHLRVLQARRAELLGLRVMITAGGCSGFQYVFRPETRVNADDQYVRQRGRARERARERTRVRAREGVREGAREGAREGV